MTAKKKPSPVKSATTSKKDRGLKVSKILQELKDENKVLSTTIDQLSANVVESEITREAGKSVNDGREDLAEKLFTQPVEEKKTEEVAGPTEPETEIKSEQNIPAVDEITIEPITNPPDATVTLEESNGLRWILILTILFLLGLIGGLFYLFEFQNKPIEKNKSPLKTVAVYTPTPSPVPVDKAKYTIRVENGSGLPGEAAAVQGMLTGLGYKVSGIGNAPTSDYTQTELKVNSNVDKDYLSALEKDLGTKYDVDSATSPIDPSETSDIVVIIGSKTK